MLSSAHRGTGERNPARSASPPSGSGCSIISTPASNAAGMNASSVARDQPSLTSTMRRASGAFVRTARSRSISEVTESVPSFTFRSTRSRAARARSPILSGESRLKVSAVTTSTGRGTPANFHTARPLRFAARSHNAQSRALRAAPAGRTFARAARSNGPGNSSIIRTMSCVVSP